MIDGHCGVIDVIITNKKKYKGQVLIVLVCWTPRKSQIRHCVNKNHTNLFKMSFKI